MLEDIDGSQIDEGSESLALDHFYMLFEICRSNLFQIIASRKKRLQPPEDAISEATFFQIIKLDAQNLNMFTEQEMLALIQKLVSIFAQF